MVLPWPRSRRPAAVCIRSSSAGPRADRSASTSPRDSVFPALARASARRSWWAASIMLWSNLRPVLRSSNRSGTLEEDGGVKIVALAGGVGAGKFLRGLVRTVPPEDVTAIVNTGDDIVVHGLHVSPDLDSVTYWLAGVADRERGWGRAGETFRATEELRAWGTEGAWFGLGDLDLATHLARTGLLASGSSLSEATAAVAHHFGVEVSVLPMSDDPVTTRMDIVDEGGQALDLLFQEYWVRRGARDDVKGVRFAGAPSAR